MHQCSRRTSPLPPPFHIQRPLTEIDFAKTKPYGAFLNDFNNITNTIQDGFASTSPSLNCEQWIWSTTQLILAIYEGLRVLHLGTNILGFINNLGLDEAEAINMLGQAIGALHKFFTADPTFSNPSEWQQCLCCLQITHTTVTEEH